MSHDLLDLVGNIDERYIEQASGKLLQERKRSAWPAVAAAVVLVVAGGLLLHWSLQRNQTPDPSLSAAASANEPTDETDPIAPLKDVNALDIDFDYILGSTENSDIIYACRYARSRMPSVKNEMTGLFAGKNLILITAQNFCPQVIDPERTPTLYRLATQGIKFTDYYQPMWGGATASGEFAILTGLAPAHGVQSILDTVGKDMYFTLGNQLRRQGYSSRAFCDDHSSEYLHRDLTHPNLGYDDYLGIGNGLDLVMTEQWPYSDREMMGVVISQILDGQQPFSVYCMMCSGIGVYNKTGNAMAAKHWAEVESLPWSDTVKAYLAANMEVEYALRDLLDALERAGIADDTVIVLTSSEYPYALEKDEDYANFEDYLAELYGKPVENCFDRDRSTLIVWSGCLEGMGYQVSAPTSSLDIVPTLSNLFGLEYDSRLLPGRDVFSDQVPLVLWSDGSWKTDLGQYNAQTGIFTPAGGATLAADYPEKISQEVTARITFSEVVLEQDLLQILLPEKTGRGDLEDNWRPTPGSDPIQVIREALNHESERDYTVSLTVEELRLDEAEKQKCMAGDRNSEMALRGGYGLEEEKLMALPPEEVTVVYARYQVEYDHDKTWYTDGDLDQYFYLMRNTEGNWELYSTGDTRVVPADD